MARVASYRKQKRASGDLAFIVLDGQRTYLGAYGTKQSKRRYATVLAEYSAGGSAPKGAATVNGVVDTWVAYMERQDGRGAAVDLANGTTALRLLCRTYGTTKAERFGAVALETLRHKMVTDTTWSRTYINKQTARIRRLFRWAARRELIPATVPASLALLDGLRSGHTGASESKPVMPVAADVVVATIKHLSPTLAAMVEVLRLSGARPGEICGMKTTDVDTSSEVWTYAPRAHKTSWRGKRRTVYLGPRVQEVLRPFLKKSVGGAVFSPIRAEAERLNTRHEGRVTPMSCGNRPGSNRKRRPGRQPGEHYSTMSLGHAITKACDAAGVQRWSPGQLRHTVATAIRAKYGVEAAGSILGHVRLSATEIYAEVDASRAAKIMQEMG